LFHLPTNNIGCITGGKLLEFQRNVANLPDLLQIEVLKMIEENPPKAVMLMPCFWA